jgi:hypothetical protein
VKRSRMQKRTLHRRTGGKQALRVHRQRCRDLPKVILVLESHDLPPPIARGWSDVSGEGGLSARWLGLEHVVSRVCLSNPSRA